MSNEIVLFETEDNQIMLDIPVSGETVWLTQDQMSKLKKCFPSSSIL